VKVACASNTFSADPALREALSARFPGAVFNLTGRVLAGQELLELLAGAPAAIMGLEKIDAALLDACPALTVISKFGVGLDNVDLPHCARRGIAVLSSPGVNAEAVAELTLGFMIAAARRIAISTHYLKSGRWVKHGGVQVLGKRVGLIGLGHVGKRTAQLLQAVGCEVDRKSVV
jgi:D-3-phosphoglycerate dehydrogenase